MTSKLVYTGELARRLKFAKFISLSSSFVGLACTPFLIKSDSLKSSAFAKVFLGTFGSFFIFGTPVLLQQLAKRYALKIFYDCKTEFLQVQTMTFLGRKKLHSFHVSAVVIPSTPGPFTTFLGAKRPYYIYWPSFKDLDLYSRMVKYDKPIEVGVKSN